MPAKYTDVTKRKAISIQTVMVRYVTTALTLKLSDFTQSEIIMEKRHSLIKSLLKSSTPPVVNGEPKARYDPTANMAVGSPKVSRKQINSTIIARHKYTILSERQPILDAPKRYIENTASGASNIPLGVGCNN